MGLFSFFKKAGKSIFSKIEEAEAKSAKKEKLLEKMVSETGIKIEDLSIEVSGEKVTVSGKAKKQEDKEKVILVLGNVDGISTVDDRLEVEEDKKASAFYEVKSGDTLSKIAKAHYGDAMRYMEIFEANQPLLKDPNKIYPGQMLRIP